MSKLASSLVYHAILVHMLIHITSRQKWRQASILAQSSPIRQRIYNLWIYNDHRPVIKGDSTCTAYIPQGLTSYQDTFSLKSLGAKERMSIYRQNPATVPVYTDQSLSSYTVTNRSHLLVQMRSFLSVAHWWMGKESVKHHWQTHTGIMKGLLIQQDQPLGIYLFITKIYHTL